MNTRPLRVLLGAAALGAVFVIGSKAPTQEPLPQPPEASQTDARESSPAAAQEGVEVMARGPVHEAFAEPVIRSPRATPIVPKQPPDAIEELPPDQKPEGDNVLWIPGYWAWDDDRADFLWVSGIWRVPPPDRQWTPGYWQHVEDGWQWVPGLWADQNQNTVDLLPQPPDPVAEAQPPAPDNTSTYSPGCWVYRGTRYLWRPGFWVQNRPGWAWISSCYRWTPAGYIFIEGHWDYPLHNRGLLFAPVVVEREYWNRPNWSYRPSYVVSDEFLTGALFVRPTCSSYYFGDYFDRRYDRQGYVAWVDYRIGREGYDPLYNYDRWQNREHKEWAGDLLHLYDARRSGDLPRPPRTLVQQTTLIQNINNTTVNNTTVNNIKNVTVLAPLNKVDTTIVKLQAVPRAQRQQWQNSAVQYHKLSQDRMRADARVIEQGPAQANHPVQVDLPRARVETPFRAVEGSRAAPPVPLLPSAVARPHSVPTAVDPGERHARPPTARQEKPQPVTPREEKPRPTSPLHERPQPLTPREEHPVKPIVPKEQPLTPIAPRQEKPRPETKPEPTPRPIAPRDQPLHSPEPKPVAPHATEKPRTPEPRPLIEKPIAPRTEPVRPLATPPAEHPRPVAPPVEHPRPVPPPEPRSAPPHVTARPAVPEPPAAHVQPPVEHARPAPMPVERPHPAAVAPPVEHPRPAPAAAPVEHPRPPAPPTEHPRPVAPPVEHPRPVPPPEPKPAPPHVAARPVVPEPRPPAARPAPPPMEHARPPAPPPVDHPRPAPVAVPVAHPAAASPPVRIEKPAPVDKKEKVDKKG